MRRGRKKEPREYVEMRMKQLMEERQKANDKIKINKLKARVIRFENIAKHWYNESKNVASEKELKELREENYNLSYKLNEIQCALNTLKQNSLPW